MKEILLLLSLLAFSAEVLKPGSRFVRVGAAIKKSSSLFYVDTKGKLKVHPKLIRKKSAHVVSNVQPVSQSAMDHKSIGKKSASHKAAPRSKTNVAQGITPTLEDTFIEHTFPPPPLIDLLRPPIA